MEKLFGKNRWLYWLGMLVLVAGVGIVLARRKSPEEIARIKLARGDAAFNAGHYDQAIAFYKGAISKNPGLLSAYYNLALSLEYEDETRAVKAWDDYLARAEGVPAEALFVAQAKEHRARLAAAPYVRRAAALRGQGDHLGARAAYEEALRLYPSELQTYTDAAANEAEVGDHVAAARYYERALELAPYSMNIRYQLGLEYEYVDKRAAARVYAEVLEMSKTNVGISAEKLKDIQRRLKELRGAGYGG